MVKKLIDRPEIIFMLVILLMFTVSTVFTYLDKTNKLMHNFDCYKFTGSSPRSYELVPCSENFDWAMRKTSND